ncbi:MAG: HPr family phosphocarrier protein [Candidatus Muiribacteriota bacterium]
MYSKKIVIKNELGIHARPASMIVDTASKYNGEIKLVKKDGMKADAKSILSIMMLAAEKGTELEITAQDCEKETEVVDKIAGLFENKFGEE